MSLSLPTEITDLESRERTIARFKRDGIVLPTFAQLADPATIPEAIQRRLLDIDPDAAHPLNLFRVHWHNGPDRCAQVEVPAYLELPRSLTGVKAKILLALGERFPMIGAHKVLAAYACLVPRLVTGRFDPTRHRAIWPSTGNYCRGGVAISRILDCRGVAVLPEGMSAERFEWLGRWVGHPEDIIRTHGTESNVKEIYDACHTLGADPDNQILNQFSQFENHLGHYAVTGPALGRVFHDFASRHPNATLRAFVSATGSAGTIAAGDWLAEHHGSRTVAVEALECPTMLMNGYGAHNIQGIGDKHIPLIHNVMGTDFVVGVSDVATDLVDVLFQTSAGRRYLIARKGIPADLVVRLGSLGLSSVCNLLAAIKVAKYLDLGPDDVIVTVATDGAALYPSELAHTLSTRLGGHFDEVDAAEIFGRFLLGAAVDHVMELDHVSRNRIFNLGYYTWVEQQGVSLEDFEARRDPRFWKGLREALPVWDALITELNARVGAS